MMDPNSDARNQGTGDDAGMREFFFEHECEKARRVSFDALSITRLDDGPIWKDLTTVNDREKK